MKQLKDLQTDSRDTLLLLLLYYSQDAMLISETGHSGALIWRLYVNGEKLLVFQDRVIKRLKDERFFDLPVKYGQCWVLQPNYAMIAEKLGL